MGNMSNETLERWLKEIETVDRVGRDSTDRDAYVCETRARYGEASRDGREDYFSISIE